MSRTIYAKRKWFEYLVEHCLGSSGEGGSLIGMRRSFWGQDAYVVRCCKYLFKVSEEVFNYVGSRFTLKDEK